MLGKGELCSGFVARPPREGRREGEKGRPGSLLAREYFLLVSFISLRPNVFLLLQEWNRMSDEEKLPYQTKAHDDTMRYREAMTVFKDGGAGVCAAMVFHLGCVAGGAACWCWCCSLITTVWVASLSRDAPIPIYRRSTGMTLFSLRCIYAKLFFLSLCFFFALMNEAALLLAHCFSYLHFSNVSLFFPLLFLQTLSRVTWRHGGKRMPRRHSSMMTTKKGAKEHEAKWPRKQSKD